MNISQYTITWYLSGEYTTGQYANGDYWVVGPVTITGIDPASTSGVYAAGRTINGSMVNPYASPTVRHGFDSATTASTAALYNPAFNFGRPNFMDMSASNPLILQTGSSLISSRSVLAAGSRPQISDAAVLTVVDAPLATGTFRPPYVSGDKSHRWHTSGLNYNILSSLAPVTGTPTLSSIANYFARPWIEINTNIHGRYIHPSNNQPDYGRDMTYRVNLAALSLQINHDNTGKYLPFTQLVQYGLDIYGAAQLSGNWIGNGGFNMGRKICLVLAGLALNDTGILYYANGSGKKIFSEDQQTFYVSQSEVDITNGPNWTPDDRGGPPVPYNTGDIGTPEWGTNHTPDKKQDNAAWSAIYRDVVGSATFGEYVMAMLTTGASGIWQWPAFFDYSRRYWDYEKDNYGVTNDLQTFSRNMYYVYLQTTGESSQAVVPTFTPPGGYYSSAQSVTMSTTTPGATIYYSTGSLTPTTGSSVYSSPIALSGTTTLNAFAVAPGYTDSSIRQATYQIEGGYIAYDLWQSVDINRLTSRNIRISFDATNSSNPTDCVIGFGNIEATGYGDLAASIRFGTGGFIHAYSGSSYIANNQMPYVSGIEYHFDFNIDLPSKIYSAQCSYSGLPPTVIASSYPFNTVQANTTDLNFISFINVDDPNTTLINDLVVQNLVIKRLSRHLKLRGLANTL